MEIEQRIEWLRPERILKLYDGQKSHFGMNRLYVIGVGKNGTDCALRCMHLVEKRFGSDPKRVRFLCIGEESQLAAANHEGSVPSDGDILPIKPEEAIYKYLNEPAKLPDSALDWFDQGLKNYSPAAPVYGLTKRQCGRVALFHCIPQLMKLAGEALTGFGGSDKPIDIILTGNLGDVFFGGMFIDLAYILTKIFSVCPCPVRVNGYLFAADTAALIEKDSRDMGYYAANTIIARSELDKFQCHKKRFAQKYTATFEVDSDKPPFNACFLIPAEDTYDHTMECAAEKIVSRMEVLFSKDDDAERIMSYNMLRAEAPHDFRYLSYGVSAAEIPLGKIMSYLSIKLFMRLNHILNGNDVGEMLLGQYAAKMSPSVELVASKSGSTPQIEFDERFDPSFSLRSIKSGSDNALKAAEKWAAEMRTAVEKGGPVYAQELSDSIIADCEAAKTDFSRGPFYAQEILRKCLSELRVSAAKVKSQAEDMTEQVERTRGLERAALKKVKSAAIFANKAAEQYLYELKCYAEAKMLSGVSEPMEEFFRLVSERLNDYYNNVLQKAAAPFEQLSVNRGSLIDDIMSEESGSFCVKEVFRLSDENVTARLDELADSIPKDRIERYFKESEILDLPDDDEKALGRAVVGIIRLCFEEQLSMSFGEMCEYFGSPCGIADALRSCIESCRVTAPVSDSFSITRVICPKAVRQEDIAELHNSHKGVGYIWNGSVCSHTAVAAAICAGTQIEKFNGYQQWENMHYAYVNDSLKKHGIKIF